MKKKFLLGLGACCLSLGISGVAGAAGTWSGTVGLDVPGFNGSQIASWEYKKAKTSNDAYASFTAITNPVNMDARVVNSNNVERSNWARNMKPGVRINVATTASKGIYYVPEVSSDITQIGTKRITFVWSPDKPTSDYK